MFNTVNQIQKQILNNITILISHNKTELYEQPYVITLKIVKKIIKLTHTIKNIH